VTVADTLIPDDEQERLAALRALEILDTPREERFDRITRLLRRLLQAPIAIVNFIDADRQWGKSCVGVASTDVPRTASFCAHAVLGEAPLVVPDTARDPRFARNPLVVGEPNLRSYAGQPVHDPTGYRIGTLCVADRVPRDWTDADLQTLYALAGWVELEIAAGDLRRRVHRLRERGPLLHEVLDAAPEAIVALDASGATTVANRAASQIVGRPPGELVGGRDFAGLAAQDGAATLRRPDGAEVRVEATSAPVRTGGTVLVVRRATG